MKFYYKDQLIRTSAKREYKLALIFEKEDRTICVACSETMENIKKAYDRQRNVLIRSAEQDKKYCGISEEQFNKRIAEIDNLKIIELEQR